MLRALTVLLALQLVTSAQSPAPATKPAGAIVRGTVVDAGTGKPIAMVRVRLSPTKPGAFVEHHARTDADGRYEFTDVRPGQILVTASKARYVTLQHGQQLPATSGRPIDVKPGAVLERIDLSLPRASAITGRVVDEFGDPIDRASVQAMRLRYVDGQRRLAQVAVASTNDNGEYRLPALQPGSYFVVAAERSAGFGVSMEADIGFARTAFPTATTSEGARPVDVRPGLDTTEVDIALVPSVTARLRGVVFGLDGQPAANAWAVLQAVGAGPGTGLGGDMRTTPDGRFEFPRVLAGRYELHVRGNATREGTVIPLTIADDLEIPVAMVSGRMTGRVIPPEGASAPPSTVNISVQPVGETLTFGTGFGGSPKDDWTFDFDFLLGPRVVRTLRLPEGWHLRGVYRDGDDVTDEIFQFKGNEVVSGIEVVLTTEAAAVTGTIAATDGTPCGTCTAVVFAEDPDRWRHPSRFVHAAKPDQQHAFRIEGLPPGEYLVAAVEQVEDGEWLDPAFLERLRGLGERLDLNKAGNAAVALRVVRP